GPLHRDGPAGPCGRLRLHGPGAPPAPAADPPGRDGAGRGARARHGNRRPGAALTGRTAAASGAAAGTRPARARGRPRYGGGHWSRLLPRGHNVGVQRTTGERLSAESAAQPQTLTHLIWVMPAKEVVGTAAGGVRPRAGSSGGRRLTGVRSWP